MPEFRSERAKALFEKYAGPAPVPSLAEQAYHSIANAPDASTGALLVRQFTAHADPADDDAFTELVGTIEQARVDLNERLSAASSDVVVSSETQRRKAQYDAIVKAGGEPVWYPAGQVWGDGRPLPAEAARDAVLRMTGDEAQAQAVADRVHEARPEW